MPDRRRLLAAALAFGAAVALPLGALAHHGWSWTDDGDFSLTGVVTSAELGMPHGVIEVEAEGTVWTVEIGQPWRNESAGLTEEMLAPGSELTLEGQRSADPAEMRMKAERVIIAGEMHNLYPDRG